MENWFNIQALPRPFSASMEGAMHLPTTQSLIDFVKFNPQAIVQDAPHSGRPSTSVTEQTIDAVRKIIEDDPHSTYQQVEAMPCISSTAMNSIIRDYLNLRKVCGGWVPHTLTDDQKQFPLQFCRYSLKRFEEGWARRVFDIITGDESCFYHYDPKLKEQ